LSQPVSVSVEVNVDQRGRVTSARAIPERGIHSLMLSAAADAARTCRFQPARQGPNAVPSKVTIRFQFAAK
jgi:TonB family protein